MTTEDGGRYPSPPFRNIGPDTGGRELARPRGHHDRGTALRDRVGRTVPIARWFRGGHTSAFHPAITRCTWPAGQTMNNWQGRPRKDAISARCSTSLRRNPRRERGPSEIERFLDGNRTGTHADGA